MSAKKRATHSKSTQSVDHIELFAQMMHAMEERDRALAEVVVLRDSGKLREARAKLKSAERIHAQVEAMGSQLAPDRSRTQKP